MTPKMHRRLAHVKKCQEITQSINFYKSEINGWILKRQRGISGAGLKSLSIEKAIDRLTKVEQRLERALKQAEKGEFGDYMKIADWKEGVGRQLQALKTSQRKRVNVYEFSYELIDAIKDRVDLVYMINELKIRKKRSGGGRYVIICPFHDEDTPSCMIYVNDDKFHCFGCQASGDVIDFYQKYCEIEFDEAITRLCERLSIQVMDAEQVDRADALIESYKKLIHNLEVQLKQEHAEYAKELLHATNN